MLDETEDFYQPTQKAAEEQLQQAKSFISEVKLKSQQLLNQEISLPNIQR